MKDSHKELFAPLTIGKVTLTNRIVVPPLVQVRPITSAEGIAWYRRLAASGPGLVIGEATGVPRFGEDLTADSLRPMVDAIHAGGAVAAIQLFPILFGTEARPNELSIEQIDDIVEQYGVAARICLEAGFEGVEPHGAHGYLINQFFMPRRNKRTDEYGGSLENRSRLGLRIVERIKAETGDDLLIFYRHTPTGKGYTLEDSLTFADSLVAAGVDVLDISPAMAETPADLAAPFKERCGVPVIAVNNMQGPYTDDNDMSNPDVAADALRAGRCDMVAVGRQMIADARLPQLIRDEAMDDLTKCVKCNKACFGNLTEGKPVECVLWGDDELAAYMA